MKKIYVIFSAAVLSTVAGCSVDDIETPGRGQLPMQMLTAEAGRTNPEDSSGTRATLVDGLTSVWEDGDEIIVFAESYINRCGHQCLASFKISNDKQRASFRGEVVAPDEMDTYYAAHPSTATVTNVNAVFEIPAVQEATATPKVMMCAKSGPTSMEGLSFAFAPVDAFLHVTLSGNAASINKVVMEALGGEDLAGTYTYGFDGGTTSVSGSKSITVNTNGLTDFYITVPAVTLSSGYKLTYWTGDQQMVRTYGSGTVKEFCKGSIANIAITAFESVSLIYNNGFKSSYDYYKIGDIWTANTMGGDIIHGTGVHVVSYTTTGISSTLINEIGVILDGKKVRYTDGTWDKTAKTFAVGDHFVSWGTHTAQLYMIYNGGKEVKSDIRTIAVTGIPYDVNPPSKARGWWQVSWNTSWESLYVQLGAIMGSGECTVVSPAFYVPANINVHVKTDCNVRAYPIPIIGGWANTDFTLKVSGTTIIKQNSNNINGKDYSLNGNGVLTYSNPKIVCNSSYAAAGPYARIYKIRMVYR